MYASYEFYKEIFGGAIPEDNFLKMEAHAESLIRFFTFHNGDIFEIESDDVKKAVCAAAEVIYQQTSQGSSTVSGVGGIKSVNNDGYSVTFATEKSDGQTSEAFLRRKVYDAVLPYLAHTGWLCMAMR